MLAPGSYAVLGVLSFGRELSGYDVKQWADHSLRYFFGSPAQSAVYTELRRLEELGYVEPVGSTEGPRGRQRYRITDPGREQLATWVGMSPTPPAAVRDHAVLKVWLGHTIAPELLRSVVETERQAAEAHLADVRFSADRAQDLDLGYAALVEQYCVRIATARAEALAELAAALSPDATSQQTAPPEQTSTAATTSDTRTTTGSQG